MVEKTREKDSRWLLLPIILIIVIVATLIINLNSIDDSAEKVAGTIILDNGDEDINWERYKTIDIELSESYRITKSGIYHLTGSLNDGSITVATTKDDVVKLILDNVTIKNSSGPAISCLESDDLVIELVGESYIEDGLNYSTALDEDIKGTLYSKADLTIEGDGSLEIIGNHEDGIISKDDLKIKSGTYIINVVDDAIRGKDSVYVQNGNFTIKSTADAIKSTDETKAGKGFVVIEGGTFNIEAGAKGIKAINSILISGGTFNIDSYDDAIHSNNYVGIEDGKFKIVSGDDGIHADKELIVDGGTIDIEKSYEALEAQVVTINDGKISLVASDDGINAGGGADSSSKNRMGANPFDADESCVLTINDGDIYINAAGDGVDSNGYLYFNGGKVIVDGPTNDGNGALDSGMDIVMNGGEVIALGAAGMAKSLGTSSTVYNVSIYFSSVELAGTKFEIKDPKGETILEHTSAKSFNHIAVGSEQLIPTKTYTIYIDDEEYEDFTVSSIVTTVGNSYDIMKKRR